MRRRQAQDDGLRAAARSVAASALCSGARSWKQARAEGRTCRTRYGAVTVQSQRRPASWIGPRAAQSAAPGMAGRKGAYRVGQRRREMEGRQAGRRRGGRGRGGLGDGSGGGGGSGGSESGGARGGRSSGDARRRREDDGRRTGTLVAGRRGSGRRGPAGGAAGRAGRYRRPGTPSREGGPGAQRPPTGRSVDGRADRLALALSLSRSHSSPLTGGRKSLGRARWPSSFNGCAREGRQHRGRVSAWPSAEGAVVQKGESYTSTSRRRAGYQEGRGGYGAGWRGVKWGWGEGVLRAGGRTRAGDRVSPSRLEGRGQRRGPADDSQGKGPLSRGGPG